MKEQSSLKNITFHSIKVTERTEWSFVEIFNGDHRCTVEITSGSDTKLVVQLFTELFDLVKGKGVKDESQVEVIASLTLINCNRINHWRLLSAPYVPA